MVHSHKTVLKNNSDMINIHFTIIYDIILSIRNLNK